MNRYNILNKICNFFNFSNILKFLFFILFATLILKGSFFYLNPDLGWHLEIGQKIISENEIQVIEQRDFPIIGKPWIDHEWLMNAITFFVYDHFGYITTSLLFGTIAMLTLFILIYFVSKKYKFQTNSTIVVQIIAIFGLIGSLPFFGVRMQQISVLYLLVFLIVIENYEKKYSTLKLLWLIPILCVWSFSHAGFFTGVLLILLWILTKSFEYLLMEINCLEKIKKFFNLDKKIDKKKRLKIIFTFSLISAMSVLSTLLMPHGIKIYEFVIECFNPFMFSHIAEWIPIYSYPINYIGLIYIGIVISGFLWIFIKHFYLKDENFIKLTTWEIALFFFFLAMTIKSRRNFPLFFIVTFPFTVKTYVDLFMPVKNIFPKSNLTKIFKIFLLAILVLLNVSNFLQIRFTNKPFQSYCDSYPCKAIDFLKNSSFSNAKMFNPYDWGGFIIWTWPKKQIFIDGRFPAYPINGKSFLEEYYDFFDKDKVEQKLDQYDIGIVLLKKREKINLNWIDKYIFSINAETINSKKNELLEYLSDSSQWSQVYQDEISIIYVKNDI